MKSKKSNHSMGISPKFKLALYGAFTTDGERINILAAISRKDMSTEEDIRSITGLNAKDYRRLFKDDTDDVRRGFRLGIRAHLTISRHIRRNNLTPVQAAVSRLLWKLLKAHAYRCIQELTGRPVIENTPSKFIDGEIASVTKMVMEFIEASGTPSEISINPLKL